MGPISVAFAGDRLLWPMSTNNKIDIRSTLFSNAQFNFNKGTFGYYKPKHETAQLHSMICISTVRCSLVDTHFHAL
ncbi:MAG: hypothetical protein AB2693_01285, partial [Candidatus Thiodiazotropha sp.]